ncbi:phosphoserine phosphatase SerB [Plantibacter sp. YIM 135249]|uniref:phosphoserine phosphatase SerB n=1 Tax=Plantibacter sp. YIM 135249 TaxID=3423918 RepID=UPI003D32D985
MVALFPDRTSAGREVRFLVVLDADSTLIENEVIELLAEEAGSLDEVAEITDRAMRGELDFADSLRARVSTLAGVPVSAFDTVGERIVETRGLRSLIASLHAHGSRIGVVSGGFHELLDPLAAELGLDHVRANRLDVRDGVLTGGLVGPIIDAEAKASALQEWAAEDDVPLGRTVAVGDGANDLRMMAVAGLSVAFNAKPVVRERADVVAGPVDLTTVLSVLGVPEV